MFRFSKIFFDNLRVAYISEEIYNDSFEEGLVSFSRLINIPVANDEINVLYGTFLNNTLINSSKWDWDRFLKIDGFVEKLKCILPEENPFVVEDEELYEEIKTYQADNSKEQWDKNKKKEVYESVLKFYSDCCCRYKNAIEKEYVFKTIDYVEFAKKIKADDEIVTQNNMGIGGPLSYEFGRNTYVKLEWREKYITSLPNKTLNCYKYIGEAGLGKTTQMRKKYWVDIDNCINGTEGEKCIPVWIELKYYNPKDGLEYMIKKELKEYADDFELLIKYKILHLYLDGYNEYVTVTINEVEEKKKLALYIEELQFNHSGLIIYMSDRTDDSKPSCLSDNVIIKQFIFMNFDMIKTYVERRIPTKSSEFIKAYVAIENEPEKNWIKEEIRIPEKLNVLINIFMKCGKFPEDKYDYYNCYLDYLYDREEKEKKETRCHDLEKALKIMASYLKEERTRESYEDWKLEKILMTEMIGITRDEVLYLLKLAVGMNILTISGHEINEAHEGRERNPSYSFKYDIYRKIYEDGR